MKRFRPCICMSGAKLNTMKKLIVFGFALLCVNFSFAQTLPAFGLKGGLNISTLSTESENPAVLQSKLGLHLGMLAHFHLNKTIGFQPELVYSVEGAKQVYLGKDFNWNFHYLNIPMMIQYMFDNGFRIEAGPQIGFLLKSEIKDASGSDNYTSKYKKINPSIGVGLNYLTYSGFGIGGRYNFGLTNVSNLGPDYYKYVPSTGQISIFYMLSNNHKAASR
jgi:hypothetical protein